MHFAAPDGTELVEPLATGTIFHVVVVRDGGALAVCKRLVPRVRAEQAGRAAIVREAMLLSRARHPALPGLRRVGSDAHGPFVIEERVPGTSVRGLVEGWRARGRGVPPLLVAHLASAAAEALAELHELADAQGPIGLSHGDLGPEHLLLSPLGEARFVDLGAARFAGMDPALETGDKGTLPFAAPEVARGEAPPGPAGDVYALAATLLFLATGGPLCRARDEAAMLLEIGERGIAPELCERAIGLSAAGREAIGRALLLEPSARLASARELAAALSR
jgi:serine/threonine protein kinase